MKKVADKDSEFTTFTVFLNKGDKFLVAADNHGSVNIYKERVDKLANFEYKNRLFTGLREPILGLSRNQ